MGVAQNANNFRQSVEHAVSATLALADSGLVHDCTIDGLTITLPAATTAVGLTYVVRNAGNEAPASNPSGDGTTGVIVALTGTDEIAGNGFTAASGKGAVNTKATSHYGDEITLVSDGVSKWLVQSVRGTWARQA